MPDIGAVKHNEMPLIDLSDTSETSKKRQASSSEPGITTTASAESRAKQGQALGARLRTQLEQLKNKASDPGSSRADPLKELLGNAALMAHAKAEWLAPLAQMEKGDLKARNAFLNEQLIPKFAKAILDHYKDVDPQKMTAEQKQDIEKLKQLANPTPPRRTAPPPPPPRTQRHAEISSHSEKEKPNVEGQDMSHEEHLEALRQKKAKMHETEMKAADEALERLETKRIMDNIKFIAKMIEDWGRIGN
ncbi:hypothetical protein D3870_21070 [Noviherbaspirillum cavernae]|uniref:Uncharacterized protein n=1 Tax=Noviherbaspirillum cavernae TaxID=2320862 RepID=A0A418WW45_9BURK|nr:hypothetical protein [Noviherbaspirillum cavernae]RJF96873.1 hypothetical protein D3870_21070 [Noviherbaspirillum cavernae]